MNENGIFYYVLHSNLDGRHTFSLGNKLMVDGENGTYSTNAGESATSSLCLKNNTGIKYYGLTINKPNGTSIVLKPYLVNNKAVLYDETNDMVYAPTSGDWITGNPIS